MNIPYGSLSAAMTELHRPLPPRGRPFHRWCGHGRRALARASPQFEDTGADGIRLKFTIPTVVLAVAALAPYWVYFAEVVGLVKGFGAVVLGRDATAILGSMRGAVHIRIISDTEDRIERAMRDHSLPREVAEQRQVREDRMRLRMSRRLMHWEPTDEGRYHLIIDSTRISLDEAVEENVAAVEAEWEMVDLDVPPEERSEGSPGDDARD